MLETIAFAVWDVGTRTPARLLADVRAGMRRPAARMRGAVRFIAGAVAVTAAAWITVPAAGRGLQFTLLVVLTLVASLLVEQLIGPDLRARRYR